MEEEEVMGAFDKSILFVLFVCREWRRAHELPFVYAKRVGGRGREGSLGEETFECGFVYGEREKGRGAFVLDRVTAVSACRTGWDRGEIERI